MTNVRDHSTLSWIKGEVDELISQARGALADFVEEDAGDRALMDTCAERLHQVHATLKIVEVYGAAMLAEEMEQLALAIGNGTVGRPAEGAEALMLALIQLPDYLEKLQSGEPDIPLVLLPLINELRTARDGPLMSEAALFHPDLQYAALPARITGVPNPELPRVIRKLRPVYHQGLLDWYRDPESAAGLRKVRDVVAVLDPMASTAPAYHLFRAVHCLIEGLLEKSVAGGSTIRQLLARFDRQMKLIMVQGEAGLGQSTPEDLVKNLLYYVARAESHNPLIQEGQLAYNLSQAIPSTEALSAVRESLSAPSLEMLKTVNGAIKEDLLKVKDALDLYIRSGRNQIEDLLALERPLRTVSDTLGMIGRGALRLRLIDEVEKIRRAGESREAPAEEALMDMAGAILFVERSLDSQSAARWQPREDVELVSATMGEVRSEMARAKDAILRFVADPENLELLQDVPAWFHNIAGAFRILEFSAPAEILEELSGFLKAQVLGTGRVPEPSRLEALADGISSVEYFSESLVEGRGANAREQILATARQALARLEQGAQLPLDYPEAAAQAEGVLPVGESLDAPVSGQSEGQAAQVLAEAAPPAPTEAAGLTPEVVEPEILEIFVEEAREELQVIREYYPRWRSNPEDQEALATFRRSFHTLKGSGRLVGAMAIGEYAWSIENLLNRVIDGTVLVSPEVIAVMDSALEALPALIADQEEGGEPSLDVQALAQRAIELSSVAFPSEVEPVDDYEGHEPGPEAPQVAADEAVPASPEPVVCQAAPEVAGVAPEPEVAEAEIDPEILEIFLEEAREAVDVIRECLPRWRQEPEDVEALRTFRRSFHTLKGSGRLVGANVIGEFAWSMENLLNRVLEEKLPVTPQLIGLVDDAVALLPELIDSQEAGRVSDLKVRPLSDRAFGLARGVTEADHPPAPVPELPAETKPALAAGHATAQGAEALGVVEPFQLEPTAETQPSEGELEPEAAEIVEPDTAASEAPLELEPGVVERFELEFVAEAEQPATPEASETSMPAAPEERQAVQPERPTIELESVPSEVAAGPAGLTPGPGSSEAQPGPETVEWLAEPGEMPTEPPPQVGEGAQRQSLRFGMDPILFEIFESECREHLQTLADLVESCHRGPGVCELSEQVARAFHTLHGSAHMAEVEPMALVGSALEHLTNDLRLKAIPADDRVIDLIDEGQLLMARLLDSIPAPEAELPDTDGFLRRVAEVQDNLLAEHGAARAKARASRQSEAITATYTDVSGDPELIEIFLEEAKDLLEMLDASLRQWRANPGDSSVLAELQRTLHTLKGGARLAGIMPVGDLSHAYETLLTGVVSGEVKPSTEVLELAQDTADWLSSQVEEVARSQRVKCADALIEMLEAARAGRLEQAPVEPAAETPAEAAEAFATGESQRPHQEQIRVRADLLDRLVNNAGEVSIYRSRIEQQSNSIAFNLAELEQTVERLRTQLRKLEIETETQILFRFERDRDAEDLHEEFDPLELDRFSTMQQLSRSLMETVNDLINIKDVMDELNRANETLLLQQSRVATDLQDGLLRTRMVPFAQVAPRLHRLVRQTAKSLGKQAGLEVYGASEELDRNILQRMLAPLEHILRNAVSHGIEPAAERRAADKPDAGRISIYAGREGTDVVLNVVDDGAGMDLEAIRRRAIERGLLTQAAEVSDEDIMQFVLTPGFSTAVEVTQVAGRGVGMDVVASGIKQLGGSLEMESHPGRGTSFTIRLPLTLAISEALLAQVGEEIYAIPYASIEGVVRIAREQLQEFYRDSHSLYSYAGHDYQVRHLGGMLGTAALNLAEGVRWFPVLLVRAGDRRVALQVDGLLGNRQIVVKSVGPQLSSIQWITGATILGDGRVALILDLNAMIRLDAAKSIAPEVSLSEEVQEQSGVTVMVVDDSITVRKVTTRLLERHNMTVISAKDGMDAVTKLQERVPDIMLLDIEMPRMDGFEVARHVRNTEELKQVPIVMITSRTGEKHRQRALELGVQRYLGKPYQETELLENIYAVLAEVSP